MKIISIIMLLVIMALYAVLTSCDEKLDNAIIAAKVTSIL